MIWNYFATNHGKGEVDGVRALLKRKFCKEQIKSTACKLQFVGDVVKYLREEARRQHVAYPTTRRIISMYFWEVTKHDIDRN